MFSWRFCSIIAQSDRHRITFVHTHYCCLTWWLGRLNQKGVLFWPGSIQSEQIKTKPVHFLGRQPHSHSMINSVGLTATKLASLGGNVIFLPRLERNCRDFTFHVEKIGWTYRRFRGNHWKVRFICFKRFTDVIYRHCTNVSVVPYNIREVLRIRWYYPWLPP